RSCPPEGGTPTLPFNLDRRLLLLQHDLDILARSLRELHFGRAVLVARGMGGDSHFFVGQELFGAEAAVLLLLESHVAVTAALDYEAPLRQPLLLGVERRDGQVLRLRPIFRRYLHEQDGRLVANDLDALDVVVQRPEVNLTGAAEGFALRFAPAQRT